jgi:hypothetical protein
VDADLPAEQPATDAVQHRVAFALSKDAHLSIQRGRRTEVKANFFSVLHPGIEVVRIVGRHLFGPLKTVAFVVMSRDKRGDAALEWQNLEGGRREDEAKRCGHTTLGTECARQSLSSAALRGVVLLWLSL